MICSIVVKKVAERKVTRDKGLDVNLPANADSRPSRDARVLVTRERLVPTDDPA